MSLFKAKILISNALRVNFIMRYTVQHLRLVPINSYTFIYSYTHLHIHACTHIYMNTHIHVETIARTEVGQQQQQQQHKPVGATVRLKQTVAFPAAATTARQRHTLGRLAATMRHSSMGSQTQAH